MLGDSTVNFVLRPELEQLVADLPPLEEQTMKRLSIIILPILLAVSIHPIPPSPFLAIKVSPSGQSVQSAPGQLVRA